MYRDGGRGFGGIIGSNATYVGGGGEGGIIQ